MKNGVTVRVAVDRFLGSARCRNPNTRRAYTGVLDRLAGHLDPGRELAATTGQDIADAMAVLTRRDVPLREKTLWRMLYETCARAGEILALDIADLELEARRAKVVSKGGAVEYVYWASGTAHLLRGRTAGPVFLSERRPGPARRPAARDLRPATGRARLGYDRARVLLNH
ncbi:tyrosine-type recombinase/integrase [Micromonospora vinacea]|uniref:Integrase n=1 Tax=Micromonospora vinacea TaxID=709878 RepID=A0ABS0K804_9ACTN|nr:tyrosine-type recombinase/integrase [Micromonospora vinacea]MBG6104759.1 integrase [Micromonospora vinacea]WTA64525.1 tyrosine-type recombinase/integrase [Micromonospora sp. NBC_00855]